MIAQTSSASPAPDVRSYEAARNSP
jgi:hypothetical protein